MLASTKYGDDDSDKADLYIEAANGSYVNFYDDKSADR